MSFLLSNYPPCKITGSNSFTDTFFDLLSEADQLDIAVGYITADSLSELQNIIKLNHINKFNLTIGMHYFDLFTAVEYKAAKGLNNYLKENNFGEVRLVTPFRFHGKMYSYSKNREPFAGIIGSNNLSSIVENNNRVYEASFLLKDKQNSLNMYNFIQKLNVTSAQNIDDLSISKFKNANPLLENHEFVEKLTPMELSNYLMHKTDISFEIPIKGADEGAGKSNLNVCFGEGRKDKRGLIKPRHWYEVELIVPKNVTSQVGYPQGKTVDACFDVITDDGWKFKCKVSGDYSKNFRSENDLKILGRWLKGRLENSGALDVGQPVTSKVLETYGRHSFSLTKSDLNNLWFLNFGV